MYVYVWERDAENFFASQERNNVEPSDVHAIPYIHLAIQHTSHIVSLFVFIILKRSVKDFENKVIPFLVGTITFQHPSCGCFRILVIEVLQYYSSYYI